MIFLIYKMQPSKATKRRRVAGELGETASLLNPCFCDTSLCARSSAPFAHVVVNDAFGPNVVSDALRRELSSLDFHVKSNDLYEFFQSDDLKGCESTCVARVRNLLYSDRFVQFVRDVTGVDDIDASVVDVSACVYRSGGYLACHDDELDSRRVAFVLYLVDEEWSVTEDGGALDLYDVNTATMMPRDIVRSIAPAWNSLVLFEVCPESYHQVALVTSAKKPRLTISGWFHGTPPSRPPRQELPVDVPFAPFTPSAAPSLLAQLVSDEWIAGGEAKAKELSEHFCEHSCINLSGFLRREIFAKARAEIVAATLQSHDRTVGPPCYKRYTRRFPVEAGTPTLCAIDALLKSHVFAKFITDVTTLTVTSVSSEMRRFAVGEYTLCHDGCTEEGTVLDVVLCLTPPPAAASSASSSARSSSVTIDETDETEEWAPMDGGHICYMDEDSELLTVPPKANTLSIVMNNGAMRFVKMVRPTAAAPRDDIWAVFQVEDEEDDGEEEEEEEEEEER